MKQRAFKQVDVFTPTPYFGNPLAVVMDGSGLDDAAMQRFAKWTNLSETTFLLPPTDATADYRVRIFTPGGELPFAGHPTLGSCHSWLEAGGQPHAKDFIVQECKVGLVKIRREPGTKRLAFAAPPLKRSAPSPVVLAQVAAALGLKATHIVAAQFLDNGPLWLGLLLDSPETVLQLAPDHKALAKLGTKVGAAARYPHEEAAPADRAGQPRGQGFCGVGAGLRARPRSARLCLAHGHRRRPGHRQPQRQPGAVADRRRPCARTLHRIARRVPGPRGPGAH
jgi:PhzF family phenazine biosynthesis protein